MRNIQKYIEHTALSPTLKDADVERIVLEAKENELFGVCVPPFWVKKVKREISGSEYSLDNGYWFSVGLSNESN